METGILEQINNSIAGFSKGQKKIAHYIIENPDEAAFETAAGIAAKTDVSESTVVRFATAMGYKGFPEFQQALAEVVRNRLKSVNRIDIEKNMMHQSKILENIMKSDAEKITATLEEIDEEVFELAVEAISKAKKVYVVGVRACAPLAEFLAYFLRMVITDVIQVTTNSSSEMFEQMINVCEEDVVIGISFPRYSMRTLKAMEFANNCNATVIAITDNAHSPMNLYSSCNLFARTEMASIAESMVAPMSLINALVVALCIKNAKKVVRKLEKLGDVWDDYRVTNNDEINFLDDNLIKDLKGLGE